MTRLEFRDRGRHVLRAPGFPRHDHSAAQPPKIPGDVGRETARLSATTSCSTGTGRVTVTYTPRPHSLYGRLIAARRRRAGARTRGSTTGSSDYLDEVERQHGLTAGTLERPRAFVVAERFPEDQLPAIVVESPGTADLPAADGQGRYMVRFELELAIHVAAGTGAIELAKLYALALRALAVQQPSALFMGVDWIRERYPRPELVGGRTFYTAAVELEVQVPDVTDRHAGPPDEPGWPDVDTAAARVARVAGRADAPTPSS